MPVAGWTNQMRFYSLGQIKFCGETRAFRTTARLTALSCLTTVFSDDPFFSRTCFFDVARFCDLRTSLAFCAIEDSRVSEIRTVALPSLPCGVETGKEQKGGV